jgi:hypothetical protein
MEEITMNRKARPTKTTMDSSSPNNHEKAAAPTTPQRHLDEAAADDNLDRESLQENITDLLTDIRHLAGKTGVDFSEALRLSLFHYEAETSTALFGARREPSVDED